MSIPIGIVRAVLSGETNASRFEAFAVDIVSKIEGRPYVLTSSTRDLGRDGRALRKRGDLHLDVVATSLRKDLPQKVVEDSRRLLQTTEVQSLYYCSSQELTEEAADSVQSAMVSVLGAGIPINILAVHQLAALAQEHVEILRKHYAAEVDNYVATLTLDDPDTEEPQDIGLRLALMLQTGDDASQLRYNLCLRLVLEALASGEPETEATLAVRISGRLHLPSTISKQFLIHPISQLLTEGHISSGVAGYRITAAGKEALRSIPPEAPQKLLEGRTAVKEALGRILGYELSTADFDRLWPVFVDDLARLFYMHGSAIVHMVASLQSGEPHIDEEAFRVARERLADRVSSVFPNHEQRSEVRQALIDMFGARHLPVAEWLSSVCAVFVMMCTLGLESRSAEETARTLSNITLLLDTDVLLSLLCVREANHEAVARVLRGWRSLGGGVAAPVPVLEEASHHAWIADRDFAQTRDLLPSMTDDQSEYLITNAFVRTYRRLVRDPHIARWWHEFIREFRGGSAHDYSNILEVLRHDHGVDAYPDLPSEVDSGEGSLYAKAREFILRHVAAEQDRPMEELDSSVRDKARRDAHLLATLQDARQRLRKEGRGRTVVSVSSARILKLADTRFRAELGTPDAVVSLSAVAALLALTPGVRMGLGTLRAVLFDLNLAKRLSPAQLLAYRLIARSQQFELSLGRRVTLKRRLRERILEDAKKSSRSYGEIEHAVISGEDPAYTAEVISSALDRMAVRSALVTQVENQAKEIAVLNEELSILRRK